MAAKTPRRQIKARSGGRCGCEVLAADSGRAALAPHPAQKRPTPILQRASVAIGAANAASAAPTVAPRIRRPRALRGPTKATRRTHAAPMPLKARKKKKDALRNGEGRATGAFGDSPSEEKKSDRRNGSSNTNITTKTTAQNKVPTKSRIASLQRPVSRHLGAELNTSKSPGKPRLTISPRAKRL